MVITLEGAIPAVRGSKARETHFEDFLDMNEKDLTNCQLKLTYIGEQRKALPTVAITSDLANGDTLAKRAAQVLAMRVAGLDFGNDDLAPMFCTVTCSEFSALIMGLSMLPAITNAMTAAKYDANSSGKYLALSLFNRIADDEYRLQAVIGQSDAKPLLEAMGRAFSNKSDAREALFILWRGLGFHIGVLDPDSDGDGASDGREASWGTDPHNPDSDGDGIGDSEEILGGTDPLNLFTEPKQQPALNIHQGPFRGSRVVELTTSPDFYHGHAVLEFKFSPEGFLPRTDNLVFVQVFRRTAVKADGFRIPILPSLYIEYAGSPELDMHTIDGATVDHKVGELDPYYNGRDPQDKFIGAPDKQHPGFINGGCVRPTAMIYRCRTYEEHWRALNPEGIREVRFDYENAVFCENGEGKGYFLSTLRWSWGKKRGEAVTAWFESAEAADYAPSGEVLVQGAGKITSVPVFHANTPGQPSSFFLQVLALWLKNHKFPWPGQEIELENGVTVVVSQPVAVDTQITVIGLNELPLDRTLEERNLRLISFGREIVGTGKRGNLFPANYSPFELPLTITFKYSEEDLDGFDKRKLGIARFDPDMNRYTSKDLYVLRKDPETNSITFCSSRFGTYVLVGKK